MPLYEFDLVTPLTDAQRDALATGCTDIHSSKFGTPRYVYETLCSFDGRASRYTGTFICSEQSKSADH